MIRSAWLVRRSACSTTARFVATRARSRQPCSAARCRRGCPSPDTASLPANGGSAMIDRAHREVGRERRARGESGRRAKAADVFRRMATWHPRSGADAAGGSYRSLQPQPGTRDVFRNFVIPVPITTTRYVRAVEFRADRPQVLHHADVAIDLGRVSRALDRAEPGPGFAAMDGAQVYNVYGWSPGKVPVMEAVRQRVDARARCRLDPAAPHDRGCTERNGAAVDRPVLLRHASDAHADQREARGAWDRHSRRRAELRRGGQLRAPGRRRGGEHLSARALSREGDARNGDATRRFAEGSAVDSPVGLSLAGPVSLSIAGVPPAGHAAVDAVHLRQLRGESEQPSRSAAARAIGTALDRRDGPALDRGRAAPRGGRGSPQRRFRPSLTGRPPSRRPSWTSGSIRRLPPRTMCSRRGICSGTRCRRAGAARRGAASGSPRRGGAQ